MSRRLHRALARVTLALVLVHAGCPTTPRQVPPKPAQSCALQDRGSDLVQSVSSRTVVGEGAFTLTLDSTIGKLDQGGIAASLGHMVIRRNEALALQVDTQVSPAGLQIRVLTGEGFHGPREILFSSSDRETLRGSIDGRATAPLPIHGKPETLKLADGRPIPNGTVDADLKQAIPVLMGSIKALCVPAAPAGKPKSPPGTGGGDPPGHFSDPVASGACIACMSAAGVGEVACFAATAIAAETCVYFYAICLGVGLATCLTAYLITLGTGCHAPPYSNSGGGPCCPTACVGSTCCDVGENCVGPVGLCCSPGLKPCGDSNCCGATETCMGDGNCCASGHNVCNGVCCPGTDQICNPNTQACCKQGAVCGNSCCDGMDEVCVNSSSSTCCGKAHACGMACCASNESCTDPNQNKCSPCANCKGECCFGTCCATGQFCNAGSKSCKCQPNCNGRCGGAPDGCGGTCNGACGAGFVCSQQSCCQPSCTGKCGGAPDGCGGTCNGPCGGHAVCQGQTCCNPNCANKACGAPDGCGSTCAGHCPTGNACSYPSHVCEPVENLCHGKSDCCGDGSCCLNANQCYKCQCAR